MCVCLPVCSPLMRYWLHCDCGTLFIPLIYLWIFDVRVQPSSYKHTHGDLLTHRVRVFVWDTRSIFTINARLSLMLFSFGKHRSTVHSNFYTLILLWLMPAVCFSSWCSCLTHNPPPNPNAHIPLHSALSFPPLSWLCQQQHQQYLGLCVSFISSC